MNFDLKVVSIGDDSLVCVWDIHTGNREMQFAAHKVWEHCEEVPREITAMTFGPTYRRLFTAGRDNFVRIWNFNNGACLREIDITDHGLKLFLSFTACYTQFMYSNSLIQFFHDFMTGICSL